MSKQLQGHNPARDTKVTDYTTINANIQWDREKQKKTVNFGKRWGQMKKQDANATAIKTGDGLVVIDIDTKDLSRIDNQLAKLLPKKPTVETARGYHYYFMHDAESKFNCSIGIVPHVDVRGEGGLIFNSYEGNSKNISYEQVGQVHTLTPELMKWLPAEKEHTKSNVIGYTFNKKAVKEMLSYLNIIDYATRDAWMNVLASIHHALGSKGEKIARKWSMGDSEQYDDESFNDIWSQLERGDFGESITSRSLLHEAGKHGYINDNSHVFTKKECYNKPLSKCNKKKKELEVNDNGLQILKGLGMLKRDYKKIENQKYYIPQFLPKGGLFMFAGDSGSGKSWLAFMVSKRTLASHKDTSCIFIDLDSGATYTKNRVYSLWDEFGEDRFTYISQTKTDSREVMETLKRLQDDDLSNTIIVIDSLIGISEGNINESSVVKPILTLFEGLRNQGATVILIHHTKKAKDKEDIPVYAGSFTIKGAMDALYMVSKADNMITCHLSKARGDYTSRSFSIEDFENMTAKDVNYASPEEVEENKRAAAREFEAKDITHILLTATEDINKTELEKLLIEKKHYKVRRAKNAIEYSIREKLIREKFTKNKNERVLELIT